MPLTNDQIAWLQRNKMMSGASGTTPTMPQPTAGASPTPTAPPATSPTALRASAGAPPPPPVQGALPAEPGIVFFDQDSSKLTSSDTAMLDAYAKAILAGDAKQKITVEGFASVEGLDQRNQDLSLARAKAVADYLSAALSPAGVTTQIPTPQGGPTTKFSPSDPRPNRRAVLTPAKPAGKPRDVVPPQPPPTPHPPPPPPPPPTQGSGSDGTGSGSDGTGSGSEGTSSGSEGTGTDGPDIIGWLGVGGGGVVVLVGVGLGFGLKFLVDSGGHFIRFLTAEEAARVKKLPPPVSPGKPVPSGFDLLSEEQRRTAERLIDAGHKVTVVSSDGQLQEVLLDGVPIDLDSAAKQLPPSPPSPPPTPPQPPPPSPPTPLTGNPDVDDLVKDSRPGKQSKPGMGSNQFDRSGGADQANKDFDKIAGKNPVKVDANGVRSTKLPDGTGVSVYKSNKGPATVQITPPTGNPIKLRYP